jgi:hypothetical protein
MEAAFFGKSVRDPSRGKYLELFEESRTGCISDGDLKAKRIL